MRKTRNPQLPLAEVTTDHPKAKELAKISEILDSNNNIYVLARQELGIADNNSAVRIRGLEKIGS